MHYRASVKSSELSPPMEVSSFPAHMYADPVFGMIHWVRHPLGQGLAQTVAMGLAVFFG